MNIMNELQKALDIQTKANNELRFALSNLAELADKNEEAFCQVLIVVTKLLNKFGSIRGGSVEE